MHREFEREHVQARQGRTLVVGSRIYPTSEDRRLLYKDVVGVDMLEGPGVDVVMDLEAPTKDIGMFAHIDCCSVLEHAQRPWKVAANLERMLEPEGTILFSSPFVWRVHAYPHDYWRFTMQAVPILFENIDWKMICYGGATLHTHKIPAVTDETGYPYMERTEVFAFGVRK